MNNSPRRGNNTDTNFYYRFGRNNYVCKTRRDLLCRPQSCGRLGTRRYQTRTYSAERCGQPPQPHGHCRRNHKPERQDPSAHTYRGAGRKMRPRQGQYRSARTDTHPRQAPPQRQNGRARPPLHEQGQHRPFYQLRAGGLSYSICKNRRTILSVRHFLCEFDL